MKKFILSVSVLAIFSISQGQNLLTDGEFETDGVLVGRTAEEWGMWSDNGGVAEVIDGVATITPVEATDNWKMQLEQWNAPIENDKTYTVTFDAWADADRIIALTIEDPANGYAQLGSSDDEGAVTDDNGNGRSKWDIEITTEQTTYTRILTVDALKDNSTVKFAFLLAQTSDVVYIDNVSLVEGLVSAPANKAKSFSVYPNPAANEVYAHVGAGNIINIYNVTGSLVSSRVAAQNNERIDISNLVSGIYILKVGDIAERLVVK